MTRQRLTCFVPPEHHSIITGTAESLGVTVSAFLADLIENALPTILVVKQISDDLNAAPAAQRQAFEQAAHSLRSLHQEVHGVLDAVDAVAATVPADPPTSNRGVRTEDSVQLDPECPK